MCEANKTDSSWAVKGRLLRKATGNTRQQFIPEVGQEEHPDKGALSVGTLRLKKAGAVLIGYTGEGMGGDWAGSGTLCVERT